MKNEKVHQIRKFSNPLKENSGFFANCLYFSSNSSFLCNFFMKFRQILIKIRLKKFHFSFREWNFIFHSPKFCADFLVNFWDWSGAKVWQSCRAWKMLQNAYLDAKIGFDTEENEPPKVWRQIFSFFHSPPYSSPLVQRSETVGSVKIKVKIQDLPKRN